MAKIAARAGAGSGKRGGKGRAALGVPTNIVALPIVRGAISAFEGAAEELEGAAAKRARTSAASLRKEYLRLSMLPADRLLDPYSAPARIGAIGTHAEAAIAGILPAAGSGAWAREAVGRISALSLLDGDLSGFGGEGLRTVSFQDPPPPERTTNKEARAQMEAAMRAAKTAIEGARTEEELSTFEDAYNALFDEVNRMNAEKLKGELAYAPQIPNLEEANKKLEATRDFLKKIKAGGEAVKSVARVVTVLAAFV